jgi:ATP-dependent RNA helicase RhlE
MPYSQQRRAGSISRPGRAYHARPQKRSNKGNKKDYIHPSRFIQAAKPRVEVEAYQPTHSFADFAVLPLIHANLAARGYVDPTPIQDQAIPHGLAGRDVVGIANTGTGKTVAFAIPVLHHLITDNKRALIMAPTRELAQQIEDECKVVAKGTGLFGALLIGGMAMGPQLQALRANPQIVIGTPGRIKDHMERGSLNLRDFSIVVLDEVDRMLDMGFINDMRTILGELATPRQSFFFSATMDAKVQSLMNTFVGENPVTISVKTGETSDNVEQNIVQYGSSSERLDKLHDLLINGQVEKALVFDETQRSVERLLRDLEIRGFKADAIHGGKSQGQRKRALDKFKRSEVKILVATDVAARGIDVADITHVINYSTPNSYEDYVHRVGRAGRAGRQGYALTFVAQ